MKVRRCVGRWEVVGAVLAAAVGELEGQLLDLGGGGLDLCVQFRIEWLSI